MLLAAITAAALYSVFATCIAVSLWRERWCFDSWRQMLLYVALSVGWLPAVLYILLAAGWAEWRNRQ